jgi:hypothetical protein
MLVVPAAQPDNIWHDGMRAGQEVPGVVGDTWHGDEAELLGKCTNKGLLLRLSGQICSQQISLNLTREGRWRTGRQGGEDGDWVVDRRAGRNKFEFAKGI